MSIPDIIGIIATIAMAACFFFGFMLILWSGTRKLRRRLRRHA